MSSFRLILKNLSSLFTANVISVLIELMLPAIFLHNYTKAIYADWLVLSSAVSYLSNLNFGLQTFVNQDLAVRYNRGEREGYRVHQSTALRALLGITIIAGIGCLVIFFIPIERILNLAQSTDSKVLISHSVAATALYFISLQILCQSMLFGFFGGTFMGVGLAHRGNHWNNAQRFLTAILLCILAAFKQPLHVLAISQFALFMVILLGLLIDLKRKAPEVFPTLKYWDFATLRAMATPSVHFMLLFFSNYLAFELPLILIQKFAGPVATAVFFLGRKLFSFGRQILTGLTQSIGPEITRIFGRGDWDRLSKLYDYSERIIFFLIAIVNVPLFVLSPVLLHFWLHKPELFDQRAYVLLAVTAAVICVKEHKMQFQFSTNQHEHFARVTFGTYIAMSLVSLIVIPLFGLYGFITTWLITELFQAASAIRFNRKLFAGHQELTLVDIQKLMALCLGGFGLGYYILHRVAVDHWGKIPNVAAGVAVFLLMGTVAWFAFHLNGVTGFAKDKFRGRFRSSEG